MSIFPIRSKKSWELGDLGELVMTKLCELLIVLIRLKKSWEVDDLGD
jgi:hypothetical protein